MTFTFFENKLKIDTPISDKLLEKRAYENFW